MIVQTTGYFNVDSIILKSPKAPPISSILQLFWISAHLYKFKIWYNRVRHKKIKNTLLTAFKQSQLACRTLSSVSVNILKRPVKSFGTYSE